MKATIVLIADNDAENYGRKLMLEAHRYGKMGFEMARLPQHVSLKQPFAVPGLEAMEAFFDRFAKELCPFDIGGADYESYQKAYDELRKSDYKQTFRFRKLGLLYYDNDNIAPGTYFCYKVCDI